MTMDKRHCFESILLKHHKWLHSANSTGLVAKESICCHPLSVCI